MEKTFDFCYDTIKKKDLAVYNARRAPFRIYGLYRPYEEETFKRMPKEAAERVSERVRLLYQNTAGARIKFATDSSVIAVGALCPPMSFPSNRTAALSGSNAFCFDLYADGEHVRVLWHEALIQRESVVSFDLKDGRYEAFASFSEKKLREITVCFPSFLNVDGVFIGLEKDAVLKEGAPYVNQKPVVFYGSSITQGACASRAGNTYPNILSRKFNFDYINLGFAGGCEAEDSMIDYLCGLDMQLLVFDYDHNTPSVEHLERTHLKALRRIRKSHPDLPLLLLSKPNRHAGKEEAFSRMKVIEKSYLTMNAEGDRHVHFISGQDIFESVDAEMMTVDGTHPTDLGFYAMAKAVSPIFELYF